MALRWTASAHADLARLHEFLDSVNPRAAASITTTTLLVECKSIPLYHVIAGLL